MPALTTRPRAGLLVTLTAAAVVAAPSLLVPAAGATPPPSDDIAAATRITSWPTQRTVDTTDATADPTDGPRVFDHSVWFRLRADTSEWVGVSTGGSSYDTNLAAFRGPRDSRTLVASNRSSGPGWTAAFTVDVKSGQTYWIAVSSGRHTPDTGGTAVLTVGQLADPNMDLVVEQASAGAISGRLVLEGTMTCPTPSEVALDVRVSQRNGDVVAHGSGYRRTLCWTDPAPWRITVDSETGWAFQPGSALVESRSYVWDGISSVRLPQQSVIVDVVEAPLARSSG